METQSFFTDGHHIVLDTTIVVEQAQMQDISCKYVFCTIENVECFMRMMITVNIFHDKQVVCSVSVFMSVCYQTMSMDDPL